MYLPQWSIGVSVGGESVPLLGPHLPAPGPITAEERAIGAWLPAVQRREETEPRPPEKLPSEVLGNAVRRTRFVELAVLRRRRGAEARDFLICRMCDFGRKRARNASGNASSEPDAPVGLSPSQVRTFLSTC
ncbi:unnamed protein product [Pleuronectes platessa]|uniref:Uncharacterized protein n=1 Tax=Pleuronectes platessa TaxID=8262 RepID=A0A9N7UAN3_PLEPL|nr:unnamed protein product [Pleuronectes platessa]